MLTYAESRPDARLRPYVQSFWTWDAALAPGERFVHHVWPDGCVSVVISLAAAAAGRPTATVIGPCVGPRRVTIDGGLRSRGVRFRPEAGAIVLRTRARDLADRAMPLIDLIGDEAIALARAVGSADSHRAGIASLRAWVRRRLTARPALDDTVAHAVETIAARHGRVTIAALASDADLSTRQLERRFQDSVGLSPKQYARIRRMRSLLAVVLERPESWASMAAASGYADQAHCARELSRLTGLSPRALQSRLRAIAHRSVRP